MQNTDVDPVDSSPGKFNSSRISDKVHAHRVEE